MYRKYHTEGFLLESFNLGEANKLFLIFTKKLGLLKASARSVRSLKSKLRYGLVNYNYSLLTVIKSKRGWKITGASPTSNVYFNVGGFQQRNSLLKIFTLLKKLVPEEEPNSLLFDVLLESFHCFQKGKLNNEQCKSLECLTVLRILKNLGYLNYPDDWQSVVEVSELNLPILDRFTFLRKEALFHINRSLKESQLM
jgi:DNA repair protein RecO (recombination protein O)